MARHRAEKHTEAAGEKSRTRLHRSNRPKIHPENKTQTKRVYDLLIKLFPGGGRHGLHVLTTLVLSETPVSNLPKPTAVT